jgi:hypothetical protein
MIHFGGPLRRLNHDFVVVLVALWTRATTRARPVT